MKKKITIFAIIGIFIIASCKKDTNGNNTGLGGSTGDLKTLTQITTNSGKTDTIVTTFTYDSQNRVATEIGVTSIGGSIAGTDTTTYAYYTDSVVQVLVGVYRVTYILNSSGYRTSDNIGDSWVYDANGYLKSAIIANSNRTYTYNASNQLATQTNATSTSSTTDTYSYSSNPIAMAGTSWQSGKSAGALWTTDIQVKGAVTTTFTYTYVTNSQNRLSKQTVASSAAGSTPAVTFFAYY